MEIPSPDSQLSKSARSKRRSRAEVYQLGAKQRKFKVSQGCIDRIDQLKRDAGLPSRDLVVNRILLKSRKLFPPETIKIPPGRPEGDRVLVLTLPKECSDYIRDIRRENRRTFMSAILEHMTQLMPDISMVPGNVDTVSDSGEQAVAP
ncbi:hypothetical protein [Novosphingobium terrae]|uniref:hypothetical protein n=1 Tax=Novosphingobium terrae TaxID=2726189 RepID=UPI00197CBC16|nr:hypothetical protein [Novosphingobium terrae]